MKKVLISILLFCSACSPINANLPRAETPTNTLTPTPHIPAEAQLHAECRTLESISPGQTITKGTILLSSRLKPESYLLDMATNKSLTIENGDHFAVSSNRKLVAYQVQQNLIISNASGQVLKTLPWKKEWQPLQGWVDNERLLIMLDENHSLRYPFSLIVLNAFTEQTQQVLHPNFSDFLDVQGFVLPYWNNGWYGVMYDSTLTRAVYLRFVENDKQTYTYGLWDVTKHRLVASLENIFSVPISANIFSPPYWAPDGSKFAFSGFIRVFEQGSKLVDHVESHLYLVSKDGQVKPLTHLSYANAGVVNLMSWSPDGRYLAGFMTSNSMPEDQMSIILIDTTTSEVTNYCIPLYFNYDNPLLLPIWSPDGKQFLVTEIDAKNHWRVILVDTEKPVAYQIATDVEAVGWMSNEP